MIKLDSRQQNKNITRSVYGILMIVIIVFGSIVVLLQLQSNESARREKLANDYHLAISNKSLVLLGSIDKFRLWIRDNNSEQSQAPVGVGNEALIEAIVGGYSTRDYARALDIEIDKIIHEINYIHKLHANEEFEKLHQILRTTETNFHNDIGDIPAEGSYSTDKIDSILAPLIAVAHQLQRAHQQAYQEMRLSLADFLRQKQTQIIILIAILLVIGLFGVVKMLRLVNNTLTELTRAQNELHEKESRLREAQHVAHMGYIEWLPNTNEITWSEETYNIYGVPPDFKPTLESTIALVHPDDAENVTQAMYATLESKKGYDIEYRVLRPDDTEIFIQAKGDITVHDDGKVNRLLSTVINVTAAKSAEAALFKYRDQLEDLVTERTKELERLHEELIRKERLATLGQLTGTVSHELRNPLGAIKSALYIIEKLGDKEDERLQKAIVRANRNIERCTQIIEELLDFTRVTKLLKHDTPVDEWLDSVVEELGIPEGIHLEKDFNLEDVELNIDPERLRRALINIFENACQAMLNNNQMGDPLPGSHLHIGTANNDNRLEITITDNGPGMPESVLAKIFEPLFSTKSFGVGLGMPTVKQIMEQHDGGIEVDTEEGKGTTVILWLPDKIDIEAVEVISA